MDKEVEGTLSFDVKKILHEFIQRYRSHEELNRTDYSNRIKKVKAYDKLIYILERIDPTTTTR